MRSDRFNHTSSVGQHLHALNLKHRSIVHHTLDTRGAGATCRQYHAESRIGTLDAAANHQSVSRLKDVQDRRHSGKRKGANEDRRVKASVPFFLFKRTAPLGIFFREDGFDCSVSAIKSKKRGNYSLTVRRTRFTEWSWKNAKLGRS